MPTPPRPSCAKNQEEPIEIRLAEARFLHSIGPLAMGNEPRHRAPVRRAARPDPTRPGRLPAPRVRPQVSLAELAPAPNWIARIVWATVLIGGATIIWFKLDQPSRSANSRPAPVRPSAPRAADGASTVKSATTPREAAAEVVNPTMARADAPMPAPPMAPAPTPNEDAANRPVPARDEIFSEPLTLDRVAGRKPAHL